MQMRRFIWMPATIIVVSGLAGAAAGCSGSGLGVSGGGASGGGNAVVQASAAAAASPKRQRLDALVPSTAEPFSASQDAGRTAADGGKLASDPLKALPALRSAVIKTGSVRLRVDHGQFGQTRQAVRHIAGTSAATRPKARPAAPCCMWADHHPRAGGGLHDAVDALEGLTHVHVTAESVTGQDVSQQFVDLHARLVNLGAQERVLLRLMDRAQTISESIRVENYLQQVEFQIEDVQGRIMYLQNRTSMSTITVALHEAGKKPAPPQHASAFWKAGSAIAGRRRGGRHQRHRRSRAGAPDLDPRPDRGARGPPSRTARPTASAAARDGGDTLQRGLTLRELLVPGQEPGTDGLTRR